MKQIKCEFHGISPLIMHSCQCVNPLHPITLEMKKINAKKKNKTEEDLIVLSDLEWEAGLYYDESVGVYIPAENIEATIREGAKARRKGKDIVKGFQCEDMMIPLDIGENLTKEEMKKDFRFRDVRAMRVMSSRVMRTRPRFNMWNLTFTALYDEKIISFNEIVDAIEYAGQYVGLCDSRPKYGKFVAKVEELN